jgi:hypothetical protein
MGRAAIGDATSTLLLVRHTLSKAQQFAAVAPQELQGTATLMFVEMGQVVVPLNSNGSVCQQTPGVSVESCRNEP